MTSIIPFAKSELLSLGVEVELQIIDPETRNLLPISPSILDEWSLESPHLKPEIFQSMLEIDTPVCTSVHEAERELLLTSTELQRICRNHGARLSANGTHPFAQWQDRIFYPSERYRYLLERNQHITRRLMIYGLHVHLGMKSGDHCIAMMNEFLYYLPHLLALSASSPFWTGNDTGLASSRITIFESHPAGGTPCQLQNWNDFEDIIGKLTRSGSIGSFKDIWWDFRPSPNYGTLEIRICDGLPSIRRTCRLVAFIHAMAAHLNEQLERGIQRPSPTDWFTRENKWRASRHGLAAEVLVDLEGNTKPLLNDIRDLLEILQPQIDKLNYQSYIDGLLEDLANPSYAAQKKVFAETGKMESVVDYLCDEFDNA